MKLDKSPTKLYCFSPPVMLATFVIEISLAVYALWRFRMNEASRVATALLVFLATFQLAEYMTCGVMLGDSNIWSKVAYLAITLLPPLGVHLAVAIRGGGYGAKIFAYLLAAPVIAYIVFEPNATTSLCAGNYVIFGLKDGVSLLYSIYYYGLIIFSLIVASRGVDKAKKRQRQALRWFAVGVVTFIIPTALVLAMEPAVNEGIPSIMCGFAVIFAIILALRVLPLVSSRRF